MHWVIQENIYSEEGLRELVEVLDRHQLSYSTHKVVPFSGELIPDINPEGPVVCIGAYSMIRLARARGWTPGVWSNDNFDFEVWRHEWGDRCLNWDAEIYEFDGVSAAHWAGETFFMRPTMDSKAFSGAIFEWSEYQEWRDRVVELGEDDGSTLRAETRVLVSDPKKIMREYRLWVVDREVITASQYKLGDRVVYDANVDSDVLWFGAGVVSPMSHNWVPDRAFVLDVGLTENGYKIIEVNSLNAAGLYAANVGKLVEAIEGMGY
jgi:hypothetical protein